MQENHQVHDAENDDLDIIAAIKNLSQAQKQSVLNKIEDIKSIQETTEMLSTYKSN